jgi:hypothetical protein
MITLKSQSGPFTATGANGITVTLPTYAPGDAIFMVLAMNTTGTNAGSFSGPTNWSTPIFFDANGDGVNRAAGIFVFAIDGSHVNPASLSWTWGGSPQNVQAMVYVFSNVILDTTGITPLYNNWDKGDVTYPTPMSPQAALTLWKYFRTNVNITDATIPVPWAETLTLSQADIFAAAIAFIYGTDGDTLVMVVASAFANGTTIATAPAMAVVTQAYAEAGLFFATTPGPLQAAVDEIVTSSPDIYVTGNTQPFQLTNNFALWSSADLTTYNAVIDDLNQGVGTLFKNTGGVPLLESIQPNSVNGTAVQSSDGGATWTPDTGYPTTIFELSTFQNPSPASPPPIEPAAFDEAVAEQVAIVDARTVHKKRWGIWWWTE